MNNRTKEAILKSADQPPLDVNRAERAAATAYARGRRYFEELFKAGRVPACSPGFQSATCTTSQHSYAAPILCGKEYCQDCGRDGSPIHARRLERWRDVVKDFKKMGYLVFTFPPALRWLFMDKKELSAYRYAIRRKLQRDGYQHGLARWHFFGDCESCDGAGCHRCNGTGAGKDWHPHLNILIPGGYISNLDEFIKDLQRLTAAHIKRRLQMQIRARYAYLEKYQVTTSAGEQLINEISDLQDLKRYADSVNYVINYSYTSDRLKITNRLKYVLRSTFRNYNEAIKETLHNYRNCTRWGWKKGNKADKMLAYCPACEKLGQQALLIWNGIKSYNNQNCTYEGKGIYRLFARKARDSAPLVLQTAGTRAKPTARISWNNVKHNV